MTTCPITGCTGRPAAGQLLCLAHWRAVPSPLKHNVWNTWRAFTKATTLQGKLDGRKPYLDARAQAIAAVEQAESPLL